MMMEPPPERIHRASASTDNHHYRTQYSTAQSVPVATVPVLALVLHSLAAAADGGKAALY